MKCNLQAMVFGNMAYYLESVNADKKYDGSLSGSFRFQA